MIFFAFLSKCEKRSQHRNLQPHSGSPACVARSLWLESKRGLEHVVLLSEDSCLGLQHRPVFGPPFALPNSRCGLVGGLVGGLAWIVAFRALCKHHLAHLHPGLLAPATLLRTGGERKYTQVGEQKRFLLRKQHLQAGKTVSLVPKKTENFRTPGIKKGLGVLSEKPPRSSGRLRLLASPNVLCLFFFVLQCRQDCLRCHISTLLKVSYSLRVCYLFNNRLSYYSSLSYEKMFLLHRSS